MNLDDFKEKLKKYSKKEIIITPHAKTQALIRDVDLEEVKDNILNPSKLVYFRKQNSLKENEEKYDCYFSYNKHLYHRYVLTVNGKIIIVTIIKINRDWQKAIG
jgi:hypothetical protein